MDKKGPQFLLLLSVLVIATCGLIYELVAGTLASYLLGDSVTQFSTIIGVYLFSMGIGSWLSRFFNKNLFRHFIHIEILVGVIGGFSSTLLMLLFEWVASFRIVLYTLISITGILVGLEIPLLMRILNEMKEDFREIVSRVFTFDYLGALVASIIFPLLLIPHLGLIRTSLFFGILNVLVAVILSFKLHDETLSLRTQKVTSIFFLVVLVVAFVFGERIMQFAETASYEDHIIYSKSTRYQRVVITKNQDEVKLYLNSNLQFSSRDEYRYHEALVHPALAMSRKTERVLVLGGGDGFAARELLKYPDVKSITLVDLDPELTTLFSSDIMLKALNKSALLSYKLTLANEDAFSWVSNCTQKFDAIIIDFPDPSNYSLGKLYSQLFYKKISTVLADSGTMVVQSTSPLFARKSFWCVNNTIASSGMYTLPYHCYVPSFGEWGFILARKNPDYQLKRNPPEALSFYSPTAFENMKHFPADMSKVETEINKLNRQPLVTYFEDEWNRANH